MSGLFPHEMDFERSSDVVDHFLSPVDEATRYTAWSSVLHKPPGVLFRDNLGQD